MNKSLILRKTAIELEISIPTAFRWRHRFCAWMKQQDDAMLNGIIEADEMFFLQSEQGSRTINRAPIKRGRTRIVHKEKKQQVSVFSAIDRSQNSIETVSGLGPISAQWLINKLVPLVANDAVIVSKNHVAFRAMAQAANLSQVTASNSKITQSTKAYHTQHIHAFQIRIKGWINNHFRGVSTKYLQDYLSWRHLIEDQHTTNAAQALEHILKRPIPQLR